MDRYHRVSIDNGKTSPAKKPDLEHLSQSIDGEGMSDSFGEELDAQNEVLRVRKRTPRDSPE